MCHLSVFNMFHQCSNKNPYTVECRYNAVQYRKILHKWLHEHRQNINQMLDPQKKPHTSPQRARYGMSFGNISEKIERLLMAPHCTSFDKRQKLQEYKYLPVCYLIAACVVVVIVSNDPERLPRSRNNLHAGDAISSKVKSADVESSVMSDSLTVGVLCAVPEAWVVAWSWEFPKQWWNTLHIRITAN